MNLKFNLWCKKGLLISMIEVTSYCITVSVRLSEQKICSLLDRSKIIFSDTSDQLATDLHFALSVRNYIMVRGNGIFKKKIVMVYQA